MKLWRSGIFFSIIGLISGLGNSVVQAFFARLIDKTEWGYVGTTLAFVNFLSLPMIIVSTSLVHYIAHFRGMNDEARLQGLLMGSRKFLLRMTFAGSLLAALLLHPLSQFFNFPRTTLMMVALICVVLNLWATFAMTLCQGMAWFKRLAIIGLAAVAMRFLFGWSMTTLYPSAEVAVAATAFMYLAYLALLYWRKDLFKQGDQISPWNSEFVNYLLVAAACMSGSYFFTQGDMLVAQRYFKDDLGNYNAAGLLGRGLIYAVGPLLTVLFTSRSGRKDTQSEQDQKILLGLFAVGLTCGALILYMLKDFLVRLIFGHPVPEASVMIGRMALAMIFIGLSQAIGMWSLASRWSKMAILYGALGLVYWVVLLIFGRTPDKLLMTMPIGAFATFVILCVAWLLMLRKQSKWEE